MALTKILESLIDPQRPNDNGICHIGAIVENSGPYRIYFYLNNRRVTRGLPEGQNFSNLHKRVY